MMTENMGNIHTEVPGFRKDASRFFFLWMASVVLCMSVFMSVFTPVPLVFAIIHYGRLKGALLGIMGLAVSVLLSQYVFPKELLVVFYALALVMAFAIAEIWTRKVSPFKGIVSAGLGMLLLAGLTFGVSVQNMSKPVRFYIVEEVKKITVQVQAEREKILADGGEDSRAMVDFFSNPEKVADEVITTFPTALFMMIFFALWINLLIIIRSQAVLVPNKVYPFSEKDFLSFTMPDYMLWLVIPALALAAFGDQYLGAPYGTIGLTATKCLGLFYFFQGFGVYMEFINYLRIGGFFRTLLIFFTVVAAGWVIAVIGLFDVWVNFRKFLSKKNNSKDEGEL